MYHLYQRGKFGSMRHALIIGCLGLTAAVTAQAQVVTAPAGVTTTADQFTSDQWVRVRINSGSSVGISDDFPQSGDGSVLFTTDGSSAGRAEWEYMSSTPLCTLDEFKSATYSWYRDASSTTPSLMAPVFRLRIRDADGNVGWIVDERAEKGGSAAPTDSWQTETITSATETLWVFQTTPSAGRVDGYYTMQELMDGSSGLGSNPLQVDGDTEIMGINAGIQTNTDEEFKGAVDMMGLDCGETQFGPFNFEMRADGGNVAPVPVLDFAGLAGLISLIGGAGAWFARRRRKA